MPFMTIFPTHQEENGALFPAQDENGALFPAQEENGALFPAHDENGARLIMPEASSPSADLCNSYMSSSSRTSCNVKTVRFENSTK